MKCKSCECAHFAGEICLNIENLYCSNKADICYKDPRSFFSFIKKIKKNPSSCYIFLPLAYNKRLPFIYILFKYLWVQLDQLFCFSLMTPTPQSCIPSIFCCMITSFCHRGKTNLNLAICSPWLSFFC